MSAAREAAERWCEERGMRFYSYRMPENRSYGLPGFPAGPGGDERFDVSGWAWPPDRAKCEVRIHTAGATLEEAVERARVKWEAVAHPGREEEGNE